MSRNKYRGINDMPKGWASMTEYNKRVYNLWYNILRRCYDTTQHQRSKGKSYYDCEVCEEWKWLSAFERDIKALPGYQLWRTREDMVIDKDILCNGVKIYSKNNCCFISKDVNLAYMNKCNPNISRKAIETNKTRYILEKEGERLIFNSEQEACDYLGVRHCTVSSCRRKNAKCKGYTAYIFTTAKMDESEDKDDESKEM